ncbi:MAG: hypothetical protein KC492_26680, partial [Myxococcales bacterium]|nr:hypothetical protein [Myxococcales bacterium]
MSFESIPETLRQELSSEPLPVAEQWRELIGDIVPADVARHEPEDGGFLLSHPKQLLEAENCFEQAIVHAGSLRTVEPVLQALTLVFFLTEIPGDGDTFMLQVTNAGDTAHVVNWSHEEGFFTGPVAWDIPSVLRIVKVWESSDDTAKRREDLTPAFGRVNASPWPFSFISERLIDDEVLESETELNREGERPRNLLDVVQPRAWWLAHALLDQPFDANALKNQLEWDPTKTLAGPHMANFPPTGLYWLWRSYFFGEAWLDDIIAATRNSKSRLVRDAVKLVEELRNEQRREVGGIDLIKVRQAVQGILAKLRNPYPEELTSGSVKFVRDDSLVSHLSDAPAPHPNPPEPAKDQPLSPWWNTNYPAIGVSGDGRMLVSGHRAHPRAGKHPSIPRSIPSVFEIDAEGKVLMTSDADQVKAAHYVTNDLFVFAFQQRVSLFERVGTRGVATQQATTVHDGTLFTDEGRTIVRFSGFHNYNINGRDARLVEVFRVDGGVLKQMCKAELELPQAALVDGALVVGNTEKGVAFRADLSEVKTKDFQVPTLGKSFAVRPKLDAREGPEVAMEALNPLNDWAFPMPNGTCVI